jgi:hypothetical protein
MKQILLLLLLASPFLCKAQSDTTAAKKHEQYCMIIATAKFFSSKVSIAVDFGQETSFWHSQGQTIKDNSGKVMNFNSVIDALNYMSSQGWLFVNAYALTEGTSGKVLNYVMRKPAN